MPSNPPSPPSSVHHRRIELQSPQDLTYLHHLGTTAAHKRLTTAIPPHAGTTGEEEADDDDELRVRVNQLVTEFLDRTYSGVRANSTAAGVVMDVSDAALVTAAAREESEAEFEEFDGQTADRIRELERRRERALVRVAALRKAGVGPAVKAWRDEWERNRHAEDDVKLEEEDEGGNPIGERVDLVAAEVLRRWEDVQRTHQRGLEGLVGLKSGMAGTMGRLEEARRVGEELEGRP